MIPRLVVVAPLPAELPRGLARRSDVILRAVGMRANWTESGPSLDDAAAILITGTCGSLIRDSSVGALVAPDIVFDRGGEVIRPDPGLRAGLLDAARELGLKVETGRLAEAADLVDHAAARQRLHDSSGASFVDMESASLGALAIRRGLPWAIVRIVTDTPAQPLDWLGDLLGGVPSIQPSQRRVAAALMRRPWHVLRLARLARGIHQGTGHVGRIVEAWLGSREA
jgi:hypothetical protein